MLIILLLLSLQLVLPVPVPHGVLLLKEHIVLPLLQEKGWTCPCTGLPPLVVCVVLLWALKPSQIGVPPQGLLVGTLGARVIVLHRRFPLPFSLPVIREHLVVGSKG